MFPVGCIIFKRSESYEKFEAVRNEVWKSFRCAELSVFLQVTTNLLLFRQHGMTHQFWGTGREKPHLEHWFVGTLPIQPTILRHMPMLSISLGVW
jgi:hypothetical protein